MTEPTAAAFLERLHALQSDDELRKIQRYFKSGPGEYGEGDRFIGVRMGLVFALAKEFMAMEPAQIERLLESEIHEGRAGALSIMSKQASHKKTTAERRRDLFALYLRRHDRINNWDLVDLAAPNVIGGYLVDKPRDVLYNLARSANPWERRTAIYATLAFIKRKETEDTFAIAEILVSDPEEIIQKAWSGCLRFAGDLDRQRLLAFLDKHATTMSRVALRQCIEHLEPALRQRFLSRERPGRSPSPAESGEGVGG